MERHLARLITSITLDPFALLEALTPVVQRFKEQKKVLMAHVWMENSDILRVNWISRRPKTQSWNTSFIRICSLKRMSKWKSAILKVEISNGLSDLLRDELTEILNQLGAEVVG